MKTTVEIPDDLFREAKATAARRGMSLKTLLTEALREKLGAGKVADDAATYRLPALPERNAPEVTSELVEELEMDLGE